MLSNLITWKIEEADSMMIPLIHYKILISFYFAKQYFYIFSDHDRAHPPKIGTIITYRFQELTNDGVPRFPSYAGKTCLLERFKRTLKTLYTGVYFRKRDNA